MPWFTPAFTPAPPPPPKPAIVYHTAVPTPPLPKRVSVKAPASPQPKAVTATAKPVSAAPAGMNVPVTLRKVVYLDAHHQGTVRSALRMIAIQTGWHFVDHAHGPAIRIPKNAGIVYISGNPNNSPAINDLLAIGRVIVQHGLTIRANPNAQTITLMNTGKAAG